MIRAKLIELAIALLALAAVGVLGLAQLYRVLKPDSFCVSFYGWSQASRKDRPARCRHC